jgi:hypothetical protein
MSPRTGRPPRAGKASPIVVSFRITEKERAAWEKAAGFTRLADWIREQCNRAAKG